MSMSIQAELQGRSGVSPDQLGAFLRERADESGVRIFRLDPQGLVLEDSQDKLEGRRIDLPVDLFRRGIRPYSLAYHDERSGENLLLIIAAVRGVPSSGERFASSGPAYYIAPVVPEQTVATAWLELAPYLSLAALLSLVISVAVGLLLSSSISRPISAVTRASEAMARGNYDQSIAVRSRDEIGRMAQAFNSMAAQVEASHRTLRDFLANVSHELRTPLTSIQGFSQAMVDGTVKDADGLALAGQIIYEESERMRRLVEDLLYLSKIESGQIPMARMPVDPQALVMSCARRMEARAQQMEITTEVRISRLPTILGDADKLEQVFMNLVDNALKYTPLGGAVTVTGNVVPGATGDGPTGKARSPSVRVAIHNTGSLIAEEEFERIFERFCRLDKSRVRSAEGAGLGLAIVQEIVQAHGGTVEVSSADGGTEFAVYLPIAAS